MKQSCKYCLALDSHCTDIEAETCPYVMNDILDTAIQVVGDNKVLTIKEFLTENNHFIEPHRLPEFKNITDWDVNDAPRHVKELRNLIGYLGENYHLIPKNKTK